MQSPIYQIVQWVERNGQHEAIHQLRLEMLPLSVRCHVYLKDVSPALDAPAYFLDRLRDLAGAIIGQPCPY